jgi:predicted glycoside hydrolase/deacetylase ChbG (UPF0249 family)
MPVMKRFMFVADDFGISAEVNRAIELAHRAGAVKLVSLMVSAGAAEDAVATARKHPGMITGLHLQVDELIGVDPVVWAGARCEGLSDLVNRPGLADAIRDECERQIETYFSLGFAPTFLNSHFHIHIIPPLFDIFIDLAVMHGFDFMRFSPHDRLLDHPDLAISGQDLQTMTSRLAERGISHADWYIPTFYYFYPPELSAGLTEITFHPAWGGPESGYLDLARLLSWGSILQSAGARHVSCEIP